MKYPIFPDFVRNFFLNADLGSTLPHLEDGFHFNEQGDLLDTPLEDNSGVPLNEYLKNTDFGKHGAIHPIEINKLFQIYALQHNLAKYATINKGKQPIDWDFQTYGASQILYDSFRKYIPDNKKYSLTPNDFFDITRKIQNDNKLGTYNINEDTYYQTIRKPIMEALKGNKYNYQLFQNPDGLVVIVNTYPVVNPKIRDFFLNANLGSTKPLLKDGFSYDKNGNIMNTPLQDPSGIPLNEYLKNTDFGRYGVINESSLVNLAYVYLFQNNLFKYAKVNQNKPPSKWNFEMLGANKPFYEVFKDFIPKGTEFSLTTHPYPNNNEYYYPDIINKHFDEMTIGQRTVDYDYFNDTTFYHKDVANLIENVVKDNLQNYDKHQVVN